MPPGKQKIMKQQIGMQNIQQVGLQKVSCLLTELWLIRQHYSLKIIPRFLEKSEIESPLDHK